MPLCRLDHFEIIEFVARGGWGDVYRARDTDLDCEVALKVLHEDLARDPHYRDELVREARILAKLDHENIVRVFACHEASPDPPGCLWPDQPGPHPERVFYLAMSFVEGRELADEIGGAALPMPKVIDYAIQIGRGLEAAHRHGIVHRDLKPRNIRLTEEGRLKLLDFGLARQRREQVETLGPTQALSREVMAGTLGYICPEQFSASAEIDQRCDLFSWGVIAYELVTGRRPFAARDVLEYARQVETTDPAPLARYSANVDGELERIVLKLLQRDPRRRYQSAHEAVTDLEALEQRLRGSSVTPVLPHPDPAPPPNPAPPPAPPPPDPLPQRAWRWLVAHRRPVLLVAGMLAVALVLGPWIRPPSRRIALPDFVNDTGDPALEPLAVGFGMELLTAFMQDRRTPVVRPTLRGTDGRPIRDPAILKDTYDVPSVLHGSLRDPDGPGGSGLAVHVEAIRTRDNQLEWVEHCEDPAGDIGRLRQMVVRRVLQHYRRPFEPEASPAIDPAPTRPTAASEAYLRGLGYLADMDRPSAPDSALAAFERALALDPGYGRALAGRARTLGWIYTTSKDTTLLARAESDARLAMASPPSEIPGRLALGRLLPVRGRTREAIAQLDTVLATNPQEAEAHWLLGMARAKLGQMETARAAYEQALELEPASLKYWQGYGRFLLLDVADYAGAERAFEQAIQLAPDELRAKQLLAATYTLECRYADALRIYEQLPPGTPLRHDVLSNRATAALWAGRHEDALRDYLEVVSMVPSSGVLRMDLGDCYAHIGRRSDALATYALSRKLLASELVASPGDPDLQSLHALVLAKLGEHGAARAEIARSFPTLSVPNTEVLHTLAKTLALCGDRDRAIAAIDTLVRARSYRRCLLAIEDEFESLRGDRRFKALVGDGRP